MKKKPTSPKKKTAAKQQASGGRRPSACSPSSAFERFMESEIEKTKRTGRLPDYVIVGRKHPIQLAFEKLERERDALKAAGVEIIEAARRSLPRPHPTIERNAKLFIPENDRADRCAGVFSAHPRPARC